ncbi:Syntaxin of plant 31 isoform 1 [Dorcoceras hygrometricum]|uniref:Syntaxin of plant 31 isoform 1 n=1 Tax=Dorcoceras hygrometricum TaxID=472368 RepID=A0A2Z7B5N4_9LAMI|nr:Syntaxin of plant 31 isoform 1 [Dorcoceras hygrometricum]
MSLLNLQDVCIAIGSLATLDLPMVVDLIGIYGLKGPYLYQPGKSVVRDLQARHPSQLDGFRHNRSVGNHSDDSVVPFRHDTSVCRSQRGSISARTKLKTARNTYPEAHSHRRTLYSDVAKTHQLTASSRSLSNVESSHLTCINLKSYSRRAQRHQSRSKKRRKSTAIHRRRVRMNSNYRGFTGENDEEYRVQNTLSVGQHLVYKSSNHYCSKKFRSLLILRQKSSQSWLQLSLTADTIQTSKHYTNSYSSNHYCLSNSDSLLILRQKSSQRWLQLSLTADTIQTSKHYTNSYSERRRTN